MALKFANPAGEAYRFPLTIGHLLDSALISAGDQEIIYRDQAPITYREFRRRIGRLASALAQAGVTEGSTVAIMDWDSHRYLEACFAVPMMGAVLQSVNVRLSPAQIGYTIRHAGADVLLVHRDFFATLDEILPNLPDVRTVIAIMDGADDAIPSVVAGEYEDVLEGASPDFVFRDFDENAVATTFYTTGTTGNPKGVCFTHRQLVLHTLATCAPFGTSAGYPNMGRGDVYMPLTPMFHVHAWGKPYLATMLGLKQVYPGRYDAEMICRLRDRHKVSYSHCVPTILEMVIAAADRTNHDLTGWSMTIGGSKLTEVLWRKAHARGMTIAAGYGMSETGPVILLAHSGADDGLDETLLAASLTASGVVIPLVSARIVDEDMHDIPADGMTRGELVLRAPWLTPCYVGDETASDTLWRGGWLHTQDIATLDDNGVIMIRDRIKDVIKTGGEWIDPLQIEDLVSGVAGVGEVAVIAMPDTHWGERPLAVIVPDRDAHPMLSAVNAPILAAAADGIVSVYARIDRIEIIEAMPRTSVGKTDKKALRERFCASVR